MNDWIELNLPYSYYESLETPDLPDLDDRIKQKFGKLPEEVKVLLSQFGDEAYKKYYKLCLKGKSQKDLEKSNDKDIQAIVSYKSLEEEIDNWYWVQPEVAEWESLCDKLRKEHKEKIKSKSFSSLGLNKPGVLIEVEQDGKDVQYLIGDINTSCGVCNDCTAFSDDTIVKRYKIVWQE